MRTQHTVVTLFSAVSRGHGGLFERDSVRAPLFLILALLQDGEGQPIDIQMKTRMDGTYACSYTPVKPIKHTIAVVWGGVNIPHSPYRVGCEATPGCCMKMSVLLLYLALCLTAEVHVRKEPVRGGP